MLLANAFLLCDLKGNCFLILCSSVALEKKVGFVCIRLNYKFALDFRFNTLRNNKLMKLYS